MAEDLGKFRKSFIIFQTFTVITDMLCMCLLFLDFFISTQQEMGLVLMYLLLSK